MPLIELIKNLDVVTIVLFSLIVFGCTRFIQKRKAVPMDFKKILVIIFFGILLASITLLYKQERFAGTGHFYTYGWPHRIYEKVIDIQNLENFGMDQVVAGDKYYFAGYGIYFVSNIFFYSSILYMTYVLAKRRYPVRSTSKR